MTVAGLGAPLAATRQHSTSGLDRVDLIGLADASPPLPVRSIDLDHHHSLRHQVTCEAGAIRAGAFDPDPVELAEAVHPRMDISMPCRGCRERLDTEQTNVGVDHRRNVDITMRVDPAHNRAR